MKISNFGRIGVALFSLGILCAGLGWAQEKRVEMKDLPAAVQQTVRQESQGATLVGLSEEVENGKTYYEAELKVRGHGKDVLIDSSGKVVEVEEEVTLSSLPAAVRTQIKKSVGEAKILKLESITRDGKLAGYEATVEMNGRRSEISMGPDGKRTKGEEEN